jgi:hypothetical protein
MATIWPFRHLGLKVLSVVLALLLWMIVSGEETVERGLRSARAASAGRAELTGGCPRPSMRAWRIRALSRVSTGDVVACSTCATLDRDAGFP